MFQCKLLFHYFLIPLTLNGIYYAKVAQDLNLSSFNIPSVGDGHNKNRTLADGVILCKIQQTMPLLKRFFVLRVLIESQYKLAPLNDMWFFRVWIYPQSPYNTKGGTFAFARTTWPGGSLDSWRLKELIMDLDGVVWLSIFAGNKCNNMGNKVLQWISLCNEPPYFWILYIFFP